MDLRDKVRAYRSEGVSNQGILRLLHNEEKGCPKSWTGICAKTGIVERFITYRSCPDCWTLYRDTHTMDNKRCGKLVFKNRKRSGCGGDLSSCKLMAYRPITQWLNEFLSRPGFQKLCNAWKERQKRPDVISDWHDSEQFQEIADWLNDPQYLSLAMLINVDWWQPFKEGTVYSMGGIYASLLNISGSQRSKSENIMTLGLIPGPNEPSKDQMDAILKPLLDEIQILRSGITINGIEVRVRLSCLSCDLPATRKVLGFLSCSATKGCSKCHQTLRGPMADPLKVGSKRKADVHKEVCKRLKTMEGGTAVAREMLEKDTGVRYSVLGEGYHDFDIIDDHVVDPMHCLLLGVVATTFHKLVEGDIIKPELMADLCSKDLLPSPLLGRIRRGFKAMTADDWRSIIFYGLASLEDMPDQHFKILLQLRECVSLLLKRSVTATELHRAEVLLGICLSKIRDAYGCCPPNFHMALHIPDVIRRFGPAPVYWTFAFERKNGQEGRQITSGRHHSLTVETMRKLDCMAQLYSTICTSTHMEKEAHTRKAPRAVHHDLHLVCPYDVHRAEVVKAMAAGQNDEIRTETAAHIDGEDFFVLQIYLINGKDYVFKCKPYNGRILRHKLASLGPVYSTLSDAETFKFVATESIAKKYRCHMTRDGQHLLIFEHLK